MNNKTFKTILIFLFSLVVITILINLNIGFIKLGLADFIDGNAQNSQIAELRMNRVLAMFLAGVSIPTSGFLLQEYFQNPLAGPSVLGITSVASLSVAFYIFFFSRFYFTRIFAKWFHQYFCNSWKPFADEYFIDFF